METYTSTKYVKKKKKEEFKNNHNQFQKFYGL